MLDQTNQQSAMASDNTRARHEASGSSRSETVDESCCGLLGGHKRKRDDISTSAASSPVRRRLPNQPSIDNLFITFNESETMDSAGQQFYPRSINMDHFDQDTDHKLVTLEDCIYTFFRWAFPDPDDSENIELFFAPWWELIERGQYESLPLIVNLERDCGGPNSQHYRLARRIRWQNTWVRFPHTYQRIESV